MDRFQLKAQLDHLNIPYPLDVTTPELEELWAGGTYEAVAEQYPKILARLAEND